MKNCPTNSFCLFSCSCVTSDTPPYPVSLKSLNRLKKDNSITHSLNSCETRLPLAFDCNTTQLKPLNFPSFVSSGCFDKISCTKYIHELFFFVHKSLSQLRLQSNISKRSLFQKPSRIYKTP